MEGLLPEMISNLKTVGNQLTNHSNSSYSDSNKTEPKNGYDLPVYGLHDGQFLRLHVPALTCIALSFVCAIIVMTASFKLQNYRSFFTWTKSERFVVYLAICDSLFNIAHTMDHAHIVATRNHVYPPALCEFYGFMLAVFITAQNLMVNVVAINAFILIFYGKDINFGRWDWRLLTYTFGVPFVGGTIAGIAGQLGPNGAFCFFDGVKGVIANILFTTVPLLLILISNTIMYALTWYRIHVEAKRMQLALRKKETKALRASHEAAKTMSLFVLAFFIQWWAMALYGIWQWVENAPHLLFQFVTTFSNIGGILNLVVYCFIRRRMLMALKEKLEDPTNTKSRTVEDSGKGKSLDETKV